MVASAPVQIGQVVDNKFRIDRVLAQGGMGVLVAATHLHLEQKIAVKFRISGAKADATRFMREARLAVRLQNRHVCRVMDLGFLDEQTPYIVMEYLDGNDLAIEVARHGPLPIDEGVEYLLQACDAMAEAHALGIVHRDLKPENLFLARQHDGRSIVKVLDFGISKQHGVTLTNESDLMGTPAYMAHEQWASAKLVTASADIYALGATLHFLLAGEPPYKATTIPEMFARISTTTPPPLRTLRADVPVEIEELVLSCLARSPADRPPDVLAVSDALLPFAPGRKKAALSVVGRAFGRASSPVAPIGSTNPTIQTGDLVGVTSSPAAVPKRRRSLALALLGLAGLSIAIVAIAATRRGNDDAVPPPSAPAVQPPEAAVTGSEPPALEPADAQPADAPLPPISIDAALKPSPKSRPEVRPVPPAAAPPDAAVKIDPPPPVDAAPRPPPDACKIGDPCNFKS